MNEGLDFGEGIIVGTIITLVMQTAIRWLLEALWKMKRNGESK
jgi:hypothetical protein